MSLINKGPSIYVANDDNDAINLINQFSGGNYTNIADALSWVATQSDIFVQNKTSENIVTDGLILHYEASSIESYPKGGNTWYDLSGSGNNGTLINGPTFDSSYNNSILFDGSNDWVTTSNITLGNGNILWTVSTWVKTTTVVNSLGAGSILSNASGGPVCSSLCVNGGKIAYWTYQNNSWSQKIGTITVNDNKWHNLVWVNNSNYTMNMYVDGVLDTYVPNSTSGNNNPVDRIGGSWAGSFGGRIANITIYKNKALTENEILYNYNALKHRYSLVFGYEMDNTNSYKGEPTTNIFPRSSTSLAFDNAYNGSSYGFNSSTNIQQVIDNTLSVSFKSSITKVSRINYGTNQRDYVHIGLTSPLDETRLFSFWYYGTYGNTIRPYNNDGCATLSYLDSNNNWIGTSTSVEIPVTTKEWQKITIRITNKGTSVGTGLSWLVLHSNATTTTLNNYEYWAFAEFQYEERSDHATQYTPTSRSATQSLLDLTGNNTIDLSNASFDSDSQMVFDGTDDFIVFNNVSFDITDPWSYTIVLKPYADMVGTWKNIIGQNADTNCTWMFHSVHGLGIYQAYDNQTYIWWAGIQLDVNMPTDEWSEVTITCAPNTSSSTMFTSYLNGKQINQSVLNWSMSYATTQVFNRIGGNGSRHFLGEVGTVKIFDKVLTIQEIQYNYDTLKNRFNLP